MKIASFFVQSTIDTVRLEGYLKPWPSLGSNPSGEVFYVRSDYRNTRSPFASI
jgi:hypothetical protein